MSDMDFYRNRSLALKKVRAWGKAHGFGPAARVLAEIIGRSHPSAPWTWTRIDRFEEWAESWGYSRATLHRHLTQLHDLGVLTSEVRASATIRKPGEYPVYVIEEWAIQHLLAWHPERPNGPFGQVPESLTLRHSASQNETFSSSLLAVTNTQETQCLQGFLPSSASRGNHYKEERKKESTDRVSRRLRRRAKSTPPQPPEHDMRVMNASLGEDPETPTPEPRAGTPAGRLAKVFEKEWDAVTVQSTRHLPAKPWAIGGKQRFYGWVNSTLVPVCKSEDLASQVITEFCRQVRSGAIQLPTGTRPIFDTLGRNLDALLGKVRQPSAMDRMAAIEAAQVLQAARERELIEENNLRLGLASGA